MKGVSVIQGRRKKKQEEGMERGGLRLGSSFYEKSYLHEETATITCPRGSLAKVTKFFPSRNTDHILGIFLPHKRGIVTDTIYSK